MTHHRLNRSDSRRRGSALILTMLVLLMLASMTLVLLGSAQTSHYQAREQVTLSQANHMADAAVRRGFLSIREGSATYPLTVTGQAFGEASSSGEYDYRISVVEEVTNDDADPDVDRRVYLVEGEGRVQTGAAGSAGAWTRAGLQVWIEEVITNTPGTPPDASSPAAVTVVSQKDLPPLEVTRSGNHARISGNDHALGGGSLGPGAAAVAVTALANSGWTGDVPGALEASGDYDEAVDDLAYSEIQGWVESLRQTSVDTTPTYTGSGKYTLGSHGTSAAPVIVKVELSGDGSLEFKGNSEFYGVLVIKLTSSWTGKNPAMSFSGNPEFKGLVFIEAESLGTKANAGTQLLNLNGGGATTANMGAFIIDVKDDAAEAYTESGAAKKKIAHLNGGGGGARDFAFSSAGLALASQVVGVPPTGTTTTYTLVAQRVTGALNLEAP